MALREPTDRPNIILINADDLGYGDLACYGSPVNKTPALDRLAAEGIRFTDFYQAAPVCSPSRAAMMTGCYPPRIGMGKNEHGAWVLFPGDGRGLSPDEITVARLLKDRGYATKIVGKWHLGDQPEFMPSRHGFDEYFGLPYSNDMGIMEWRPDYPPLPLIDGDEIVQEQPDQASLTERYVEHCIRFMRSNRDQPFFLYLAHMYVHVPLFAPKRFLEQSRNGAYGAAVECIDWSVECIMHELARLGLDDNTIVIFTSDNGSVGARTNYGASNAPLRGGKGTTWEGGQRLPFILRWRGTAPAGVECGEMVTSMDFLPTFARLAGNEPPGDRVIDGRDIRRLILGEEGARSPHEAFYYYRCNSLQAVRAGRWKLHVISGELYDLEADVGETTDVAAANPDVVAGLTELAESMRRDIGDEETGTVGANCRPPGRVDDPKPITAFDPANPYMVAMYDWGDGPDPSWRKPRK